MISWFSFRSQTGLVLRALMPFYLLYIMLFNKYHKQKGLSSIIFVENTIFCNLLESLGDYLDKKVLDAVLILLDFPFMRLV